MELKHRCVRFRIRDVHIPKPEEVLIELCGNGVLQGEVVDISDSGVTECVYAIVKVQLMRNHLIVPVDRILEVL